MAKQKGRSIELFLVDGDPNGMLTATIPFQWTGHVLVTNRTQLKDALMRKEASRPGVYLLLGEQEGEPLLYIGESDDIGKRIKTHDSKKDWWSTAILITSSGEQLNKAHIRYLESLLVERAKLSNKIALENSTNPTTSPLSESSEAHMKDFLENIFLVLPALKFDFFILNTKSTERFEEAPNNSDKPIIFTMSTPKHGLTARATIQDSRFIVEEGSKAKMEWSNLNNKGSSYHNLHEELIKRGILAINGENRVFTQSYAFNSPSAAAAIVNGRNTNGPSKWKVEGTNKSYKDWEAEELMKEENN
ncbi:MAG: GIY-YIG nuclease family protein [Candidatus Nitrohelix vancouverensis]|uniref:GIY-YIG nuclease family protein n=1 Tax=Candidatus Nitrohelix vancouverensis TaxID=2705534 RepID=A0A7T0G332_9BACT|nr:MAG: GIY-YIG nuclease family protein [Candidatus Nitrohelix vancouverensis]